MNPDYQIITLEQFLIYVWVGTAGLLFVWMLYRAGFVLSSLNWNPVKAVPGTVHVMYLPDLPRREFFYQFIGMLFERFAKPWVNNFSYSYFIGDREYWGYFTVRYKPKEEAENAARAFMNKEEVEIYVNPENPAMNTHRRGHGAFGWTILLLIASANFYFSISAIL
ncbi:MAG: hypothetical protein MJA83_08245 [Gammaproteobacteria bacterium]|nr:hypothetical protein [Gammaproteobacteria bacterium]